MTIDDVRSRLIKVLHFIQIEGGYPEPDISVATCPAEDLPGFDSKMWPVSMGMLSDELGVDIPLDVNIYLSPDAKQKLNVEEIAQRILELAPKGGTA
jgi:hypothetical protein